ncbi:MAG: BrnT family toxin [Candidatus Schekmanbacteria bacterium]|nr:BrnT family toxin [Candidatus Schekmanbacteria bacterium]
MEYYFEWDPGKSRINLDKHRVAFEEGATVFRDPLSLTMYDPDHSETEDRWITLGISNSGRLLVVCHTFHEQFGKSVTVRIYSVRKATKKEIRSYEGK